MHRVIALLIGVSLAALITAAAWWYRHRPVPTQEVELRVTDARGAPVERFKWTIVDPTQGSVLFTGPQEAPHPGGVAHLRAPLHRIEIEVASKGLHLTTVGPFEPSRIPTRLDVMLADLGVVQGTVTFAGKLVSGASVGLLQSNPEVIDGVPSGQFYGFDDYLSVTAGDGSFRIGSDYPRMPYYVRAWKEGFAAETVGPVSVGDPPVEVSLHEGGAIDGRLRLGERRDPGSAEIEVYRREQGDDFETDAFERFLIRADHEGTFRIEHLDTGSWLVRVRPPEVKRGYPPDRSPEFVPYLVTVMEHETTRLDMDVTQPLVQLEARLTINGRPWSPAWPALYVIGERALALDWAEADPDGKWTLRTRLPGSYRVVVGGNHQHDSSVPRQVSDVIEVGRAGAHWERDIVWSPTDAAEIRLDQAR